jgi:hypothetical protein
MIVSDTRHEFGGGLSGGVDPVVVVVCEEDGEDDIGEESGKDNGDEPKTSGMLSSSQSGRRSSTL